MAANVDPAEADLTPMDPPRSSSAAGGGDRQSDGGAGRRGAADARSAREKSADLVVSAVWRASCCWGWKRWSRTAWRRLRIGPRRTRSQPSRQRTGAPCSTRSAHARHAHVATPSCSTSSAEVRSRWRLKLALRGARARGSSWRCCWSSPPPTASSGRGPAAPSVVGRARVLARGAARLRLLVRAAAAAAPGHRRPGGAVSRRARADAPGHAAERRRGQPHRPARVGRARAARRRAGGRGVLAHRRVARAWSSAAARLRAPAWRPWPPWPRWCVVLTGPAFIRQALARHVPDDAGRRRRSPYSHRGEARATPRCPRGRTRPSRRSCSASTPRTPTLMVRRAADGKFEPMPLARTENGTYEAAALRHQRAARLLRRGRRRAHAGLHDEGRRGAVRAAHRARVSLPGLHRASSRRRSRTAATSRC